MAKPLVNDEVIVVRISKADKEAFAALCYHERQTPSEVIRDMMRHYIRIKEDSLWKNLTDVQTADIETIRAAFKLQAIAERQARDPNTIDWVNNGIGEDPYLG